MTAALPDGLLLSFYGDDFTGSAAVMEVMTFAGLPTVLFVDTPTQAQLASFADYRAIGIAGVARARDPAWMDEHLPPIFAKLAALAAPIAHYKVCSTFDSAPHVGSIGCAVDLAAPVLGGTWHPMLLAAPDIGRYQLFGNLFAAVDGIGYRLDRHPTMSRHPITPMAEADVRRHLAAQTDHPIGLLDLLALRAGTATVPNDGTIVALDTIDEADLVAVGRLIWQHRGDRLLAIGSQGVEYALTAFWRDAGLIPADPGPFHAAPADRMVIVSGSCSPDTAGQIEWAAANGFTTTPLDATLAFEQRAWNAALEGATEAALAALAAGQDPIIHTAAGPDDPSIARFEAALDSTGQPRGPVTARLGDGLGQVLADVLRRSGVRRCVVAGGDTSSHAVPALGIYALTAIAATVPGASLARAHAATPEFDGLEIALKGGQMGTRDYFGQIKQGRPIDRPTGRLA